jgi:CheY-like chemotaxis protein
MVVEDDADGRDVLRTVLEQRGATVTTSASAAEALLAFAREVPHILVSDIGLPGQDGYDLMREIRKLPPERGGQIPALALTAYAGAEDRQKASRAGFQTYLAKPAEPAELVAKVAALARRAGHS